MRQGTTVKLLLDILRIKSGRIHSSKQEFRFGSNHYRGPGFEKNFRQSYAEARTRQAD